MQTREQWKGSRNWKLVTGAATAATLSLGALAIAVPGDADAAPPSISLDERASVRADSTAGGFVPFDLGMFSGLHAPDQIRDAEPSAIGPFSADSRTGQAPAAAAPPVTEGVVEVVSDDVAASDEADEPMSVDVLSDEIVEETAEATDDAASDGAPTDGPAVTIADDPLPDDATDRVPGDGQSIADDSNDSIPDDAAPIADDSIPDDSGDSIPDDSLDSLDDSD